MIPTSLTAAQKIVMTDYISALKLSRSMWRDTPGGPELIPSAACLNAVTHAWETDREMMMGFMGRFNAAGLCNGPRIGEIDGLYVAAD